MKYCRKVNGEQVISHKLAQQLKTKNINVVPGHLSCHQCKANFLLETESLYWWSRKISICYRYLQWIQWMPNTKEETPINWYFTCQLSCIYENSEEHAKFKVTAWKNHGLILTIKLIWDRKWMTRLGCARQCNENWKQYHIQSKYKFLPQYMINGLKYMLRIF